MALFARPPIRRLRNGRFQLNLSSPERDLLRLLPPQLKAMLADPDDPGLRRLFPPAYHAAVDTERQDEYRRLMAEDLVERHGAALDILTATAGADELGVEELEAWMLSLNQLRLVLGTRLDVSEDDDFDPSDSDQQIYYLLGYLQECVVAALSGED